MTICSVDEKHIIQYILPIKYPFLTLDSLKAAEFALNEMLFN
jgi:hypothetical protein